MDCQAILCLLNEQQEIERCISCLQTQLRALERLMREEGRITQERAQEYHAIILQRECLETHYHHFRNIIDYLKAYEKEKITIYESST